MATPPATSDKNVLRVNIALLPAVNYRATRHPRVDERDVPKW
jgi:hypothetical protein